ncbi:pyridoxamine 5'-phosphate oxidase family protein [Micromonospora sp. 4G55]|uniref:pyridoxamine 5'-phosphate oxidase family protein n=1 Tax=Micromonospora sp. 4G55 TaxID=2806102 RepID=UPI001A4E6937|nr:pyridoxamine 5'-phosphate oxidase family protein [Micromonospora sp. 4G55]MBM0259156.1 pyridoxamine 5'-phosphate oxidase family protein [Micromonospora sp. 4G55]
MTSDPTSAADARRRVTELIRQARICMLTTIGVDGRMVSRPMGLQEAEFDGDLWFFAYADSPKVRQIRVNPEVNVAFSDQRHDAWVSVSGTAQESYDRAKAEQLWNPLLKTWFPDGLDTPGLTLIKVHANSAEYWDSPGGAVVNLLGFARAAVTGRPPRAGENHEVSY